jgi:outer membrane biosynthesis protein TonB
MSDLAGIKKGSKVILHMFTGIPVSLTEVIAVDKKTATIEKKDGTKIKLSLKTGKQVEPECKSEKYANFITLDDGSYDPAKRTASKKKKAEKPKTKKAKEEVEDEDEDEEVETPKKSKKAKKSEPEKPKKKSKKIVEEDEDDDDDYEEVE